MLAIKDWFLNQNFTQNERHAISVADSEEVVKMSEKAILIKWHTEYGNIQKWIPKSCFLTEEDIKAENERINKRFDKYEKLIEWAKENGVNVRARSKKSTVLQKISEAGLSRNIPQELL